MKSGADSQTGLKMLKRARWGKWVRSMFVVRFPVPGRGLHGLNFPSEPEETALRLIFLAFQDVSQEGMSAVGLGNGQHLNCLIASVLYSLLHENTFLFHSI